MRRRCAASSYLLVAMALLVGCNRPETTQVATDTEPHVNASPVLKESAPAVVVSAFLDALRAGENSVAEQLLTKTAREQTAANNLPLQPPGSPTATYLIGETTRAQGGVQVASRWTERSETGDPIIYDIDWLLRPEPDGWRVVGLSTAFTPGGEAVQVSFENVPDMLQKWDAADAEVARQQADPAVLEANQGSSTSFR